MNCSLDIQDEGSVSFKSFSEATFDDAVTVACAAFGASDVVRILRKIIDNPYLREIGAESCGDIAYVDGKPVAFQAAILRKLYLCKAGYTAIVGSTLGIVPGTSPLVLFALMQKSIEPRNGSCMWFANTANSTVAKINRKIGIDGVGGDAWSGYRYIVIHPVRLFIGFARTRLFKRPVPVKEHVPLDETIIVKRSDLVLARCTNIDVGRFDGFWRSYLDGNKGVVSSRTAKEISWMFSDGLLAGTDIMITAEVSGRIVGYIVAKSGTNRRWMVADLIALDNDQDIMEALFHALRRYLRKNTSATLLSIRGFQDFLQPTIAKFFPYLRRVGYSAFIWQKCGELGQPLEVQRNGRAGWFFGPYDGDADL